MVSKACLVGPYQRKLELIGRQPDIDLMVVVPPTWGRGYTAHRLERAHTAGYQLVVEPIAFNGRFHLHFYPALGRRVRAFAPDVIHADEEPYNLATFQMLRLARRTDSRFLWFSWQNLHRSYPRPFRWFERANLAHADFALVGSEGAAAVWRQKGYQGPLAVIPQFGVSPEIYTPRPDERDGGRGLVIGYVGRLVPEKGVDLLIDAVADLPGMWRLALVGEGAERPLLERKVRHLGLEGKVTFEGAIPPSRVPAFYREIDVLVLPSRSRPNWVEQFGRVLIEAMACQVAVVGSDCGEIPNVIGDAGLVFPEGDVAALRRCLTRLMREPQVLRRLCQSGRQRVLEHYTQAHVAQDTVAVYREMVAARA
jgi:glycosyltransferase involved in cell wall biosynthesis